MKRDTKNWNMKMFTCSQCSKDFSAPAYVNRKTCSYKCSNNLPKSRMKGKNVSLETKEKMRLSAIGKKHPWASLKGELNHNYIKDRSLLKKSEKKHLDRQYKEWMFNVKNRDNWKCRIADVNCDGRLEAHHILNWKEFPELRYDINNGITLCHAHHPRGRAKEKLMSPYFMELLTLKK